MQLLANSFCDWPDNHHFTDLKLRNYLLMIMYQTGVVFVFGFCPFKEFLIFAEILIPSYRNAKPST